MRGGTGDFNAASLALMGVVTVQLARAAVIGGLTLALALVGAVACSPCA